MAFILRKVRSPHARHGRRSDDQRRSRATFAQYDTAEQAEATVQVSREEGVCLLDLADVEEMPPIQVDKCALAALLAVRMLLLTASWPAQRRQRGPPVHV